MDAICGWLERFDVLVVGPGLGRDPWVQETVTQVRLAVWSAAFSNIAPATLYVLPMHAGRARGCQDVVVHLLG